MSAQPTLPGRGPGHPPGAPGRARAAGALGVALVLAVPAGAVDLSSVQRKADPATGGLGTAAPASRGFMVTFADHPGAREAAARLEGLGTVTPLLPQAGVWHVAAGRPDAAIARARGRERVVAAEWPLVRRAAERPLPPPPLGIVDPGVFTDPLVPQQWALQAAGWTPALTGRVPRPTIAILDGGIDRDHPEWSGPDSPLTDGFTAFQGQSDARADDWGITGHGTHVAGIAAAPANGIGIVGVAPGTAAGGARVMPVQVADRFGDFSDEDLIRGIRFAVNNGARVINISAGGPGAVAAFERTVNWATQRGAVIVAAVGNEGDGDNPLNYPAAYRHVIGVGAQCGADTNALCPTRFGVARYSNHNSTVDLVAPGDGILSTVPQNVERDVVTPGYAIKDGTSMATPYVAGVVALLQAANGGGLSPFQVMSQLEGTATDLGAKGRDDRSGYGAVNVAKAVTTRAPADDLGEINDDIPYVRNRRPKGLRVGGPPALFEADIDQFDDPDDVYAVTARRGARLRIALTGRTGRQSIYLWGPATRTVATGEVNLRRNLVAYRGLNRPRQVLVTRVPRNGRYFIDVYARSGRTSYGLTVRALP